MGARFHFSFGRQTFRMQKIAGFTIYFATGANRRCVKVKIRPTSYCSRLGASCAAFIHLEIDVCRRISQNFSPAGVTSLKNNTAFRNNEGPLSNALCCGRATACQSLAACAKRA